MKCNDNSVTYLKQEGYNVVRLPRTDISPLQVLTKKNGVLESLGSIDSVLIAGQNMPLPSLKMNETTAGITGKKTSDMSAGLALSILGNILGSLGGKLGIDAAYSSAKSINFTFEDVKSDSVEVIKLDMYLNDADINPLSKQIRTLLESDDVYIITSVIKSNKLTVSGTAKDNSSLKVDIPVIKEIVGGSIKVESKGEQSSEVAYSGETMLVFGFKAIRLIYQDGKYTAFEHANNGIAMSITEEIEGKGKLEYLQIQDNFIQFQ